MKHTMFKRFVSGVLVSVMAGTMIMGCGGAPDSTKEDTSAADTQEDAAKAGSEDGAEESGQPEETEIQVFIAASLNTVMMELAEQYNEEHPEVKIVYNADSSGTLLTQIEEGYECDIFFSAAQKQMDQLEEDGFVVDGTRANVVNNQVVVVTLKDSGTKAAGLENIEEAQSIAFAGCSFPV